MKKFTTYKCDKCNRTIDVENSSTHATISKCTITLGCSGVLRPLYQKNNRDMLPSSSKNGEVDWYPRGKTISTDTNVAVDNKINFSSSSNNSITLAVAGEYDYASQSVAITFELLKKTAQSFQDYYYAAAEGTISLSGVDSSAQGKVLKFQPVNMITVFIDGVERLEGVDWVRGTNSIVLNSALTSKASVKIYITTPIAPELLTLNFNKHVENGNPESCWGNVKEIVIGGVTYTLYSCSNIDVIPVNSKLGYLTTAIVGNIYFVFGQNPWKSIDRILSHVINVKAADMTFEFNKMDTGKILEIQSSSLSQIFPPIKVNKSSMFDPNEMIGITAGSSDANILTNSYILGPV